MVILTVVNISVFATLLIGLLSFEKLPQIGVDLDLSDISQNGAHIVLKLNINNPTGLDMEIKNFRIFIKDDKGKKISNVSFNDVKVPSGSVSSTSGEFFVPLDVLNLEKFIIEVRGDVIVSVIGITKRLPLRTNILMINPNLQNLLSEEPLDMETKSDYMFSLSGLMDFMVIEIRNPYNISISIENLTIDVFSVEDNIDRLICSVPLGEGIVQPKGSLVFQKMIFIPYSDLFSGGKTDWLKSSIECSVSVPPINQSIRMRVVSYTDLHPFRRG